MKKILSLIIFVITLGTLCSCSHTHEYSEIWSYDENSHWHSATCEHSFELSEKQRHSFNENGVCSVCSYVKGSTINTENNIIIDTPPAVTEGVSVEDGVCSLVVECISGTKNAYTIENNVLNFTSLSEDSVYSISGELDGNIIIDIGSDYKLDLELHGLKLSSSNNCPIVILSGKKVSISAKKDYQSYIYDKRQEVTNENEYSASIYALCDLEICGKGELTVFSDYNNGINTKDDLEIKNLTLYITCVDNALKGNDSVTIKNGNLTLSSIQGDGIKTTNSNISEKGNQRGAIEILGGCVNIYSACDGIDSSYNVIINDGATLNILTDKYSEYSKEITEVSSKEYYIRFNYNNYSYSVKYYNSDSDYEWVNASYYKSVSGGRTTYYYYTFPMKSGYDKVQFFIYDENQTQGQENDCVAYTDYLSLNSSYDTLAFSVRGSSLMYNWTNYTTKISGGPGGGMGGMQEGNPDKGDHSTKGIKASNEIIINGGKINIKSYDDAIHSNNTDALENGDVATGNITINGGVISLYSNDDGIHADGSLSILGGDVSIINSYEGIEGAFINISNGSVSVISTDDGINATSTSGETITISGGAVYVYAKGDGIDSNSRTSYSGIVFTGGSCVIICNSNGNSALDTESGYKYTEGYVVALNTQGGMSHETENCQNLSSIGGTTSISISQNEYLVISDDENTILTMKMPCQISASIVVLGTTSPSATSISSININTDKNGVYWH